MQYDITFNTMSIKAKKALFKWIIGLPFYSHFFNFKICHDICDKGVYKVIYPYCVYVACAGDFEYDCCDGELRPYRNVRSGNTHVPRPWNNRPCHLHRHTRGNHGNVRVDTSQQTRYIDIRLGECWPAVLDVSPTFTQHWVYVACLLVCQFTHIVLLCFFFYFSLIWSWNCKGRKQISIIVRL